MKYIQKQAEPIEFSNWKAMGSEDWQPNFANLSGEVKEKVKKTLMSEQGEICCYCERHLTFNESHIEHFRPQHLPGVDPLDYNNLLCSCLKELKKGTPLHCGHKKADKYDPELISPLDPSCEKRFKYLANGEIKARKNNDNGATMTIDILGLNINLLVAARKAAIDTFLDEKFTEADLRFMVNNYLSKNKDNQFNEFWTTISYLFREYRVVGD